MQKGATGECCALARLAQSVERKALNLTVVGSSPTVGVFAESHLLHSAPSLPRGEHQDGTMGMAWRALP